MLLCWNLFSLNACGPTPPSELKESPDLSNRGVIGNFKLNYADISGTKTFKTERFPWTDTYWPDTQKSLFRRWGPLADIQPTEGLGGMVGIASLLETHLKATSQDQIPVNLSPSEKYDIMFRFRYSNKWDQGLTDSRIKAISDLEKEIDSTDDIPQKKSKASLLLNLMYSQNTTSSNMYRNLPMSYRSLYNFVSSNTNKDYKFLNTLGEGEDWSWTGLCHGWAPAALFEATPKQHVLVSMENKKMLVTQGDIRGLLTKSWADHAPDQKQFFVGRRCNEDVADPQSPGPVDTQGRGYTGELKVSDKTIKFVVKRDYLLEELKARSQDDNQEYLLYLIELEEPRGFQKLLVTVNQRGNQSGYLFDSMNDLRKILLEGAAFGPGINVKLFGCWDTNPAILHHAVIAKIGDEKLGFVMDRTQGGQVWNQPVHKAITKVSPLTPITQLGFDRLKHLTPGTVSVAAVNLDLHWLSEPYEPLLAPYEGFDTNHNQVSSYQYLLEIDRNGRVIGGEWGNLTSARPAGQLAPDFLYGFEKNSKPVDAVSYGFDYSGIIGKIHDCSLRDSPDSQVTMAGQVFDVVSCEINKK